MRPLRPLDTRLAIVGTVVWLLLGPRLVNANHVTPQFFQDVLWALIGYAGFAARAKFDRAQDRIRADTPSKGSHMP